MNGDHLAGGVFAPCVCCMPESVRLMQKSCVYDALIVHPGGIWPTTASWRYFTGSNPPPPPAPAGFAGKFYATYRLSWTGSMSFFRGTGPQGQPNTDGYNGTATLDFVEEITTCRVWHAINRVSQNNPAATISESGVTSRSATAFGSGWTAPQNGTASGFSGYTMRITSSPYSFGWFSPASSSGGTLDAAPKSWVMSGATGTARSEGGTTTWKSVPDNITREQVTWALTGVETWGDEIPLAEVTSTIAGDAAEPPPWDDIEPGVALSTSDLSSWFLRQPVGGHDVSVNLSHSSFRFPAGWPPEVRNFPEQGAGSTFSRAMHYLEFKGWGAKAVRVTWQTRERGGAYDPWWVWDEWGEWGEERSARLALRSVEIDQGAGPEKWLRSDPLPEDPLPEDYMVPLQRQIRILSIAAA